ncbi:MAG: hypothetical protein NT172_18825 [Planctomycetota bacterium]|nr:hypothetical protein [Planctomycetota bacterium]
MATLPYRQTDSPIDQNTLPAFLRQIQFWPRGRPWQFCSRPLSRSIDHDSSNKSSALRLASQIGFGNITA